MTVSETYAALFAEAAPMLTKAVLAVPADKLDWKPAEGSRTIRQLLTEAVMMPEYIAEALNKRSLPSYDEMSGRYAALSVTELVDRLEDNIHALTAAIAAFPEADYGDSLDMPWGSWSYFQALSYPYWNLMWHTGQINYIQTMYGDQNYY